MNYINVVTGQASSAGSNLVFLLRISPINPYEQKDSEGEYPSGTIDTFHALRVGYLLSPSAGSDLEEYTRITSLSVVTISNVDYTRVEIDKPLKSTLEIGIPIVAYPKYNLGRDVKFGYDKIPVPNVTRDVPLYDIVTGEKLLDEANRPLVTEASEAVAQIATARNSTPAVIDSETIDPILIADTFVASSEVSNTLLGVDRQETQLSLFSDVSVLGFDEDYWEVFTFRRPDRRFSAWDRRGTRDFGNHYDAQMIEVTDEQAIQIGTFPTPYVYPFGPRWNDQGLYNEQLYNQYKNFIQLGNDLYDYFSEANRITEFGLDDKGREFREQFLNKDFVTLNGDDVDFNNVSDAEGFVLIDTWTRTWVDILDNRLRDPRTPDGLITAAFINSITNRNPPFDETRPGYESGWQRYGYMQSRKAYRYQPGRISGFTFGARASSDSGSNANTIEWGISNPTDEYVFQIRGASFNIVRRSTVPLDPDVVRAQGLDPSTDQVLTEKGDPFDIDPDTGELRQYFEMVIPRERFNGDPLNGNGPSGYLLTTQNVTMYKIEFGWYGAIGAKFYAYIPIDNGEARWVLIHTLVIENKLGEPCLADPYFRFKYTVNIQEAARVRFPQFIYKYGASCYIDGGDDGTVVQRSYKSGVRNVNQNDPKSLMGIYPKTEIINDSGFVKPNKKSIFPKSASLTASELTKVEVVTCTACPGFGHNYNHGLASNESGRVVNIKFLNGAKTLIEITTTDEYFTEADIGSKIIADGLWSGYIDSVDVETGPDSGLFEQASVVRMIRPAYSKTSNDGYPDQVYSITADDLITIPVGTEYPYPVRLTKYDAVAGSTTPLTGTKIDIQFLNPSIREDERHFAEFLLGVTDRKPTEYFDSDGEPQLGWDYEEVDPRPELPFDDMIFAEITQSTTRRNRFGYEIGESNYPPEYVGEIDYRIPVPPGDDSGVCSKLTVELQERQPLTVTMVQNNPKTGAVDGQYYLTLSGQQFPSGSIINGEIGIASGDVFVESGILFTSEQDDFESDNTTIYFAQISGQLPGVNPGDSVQIALTPVRLFGQHVDTAKIMKFNPFPLYLVCMMRDNSLVNSVSIKEVVGNTTVASTPKWILNPNMSLSPAINSNAVDDLPPVNFISENRLDSASIDTQLEQKLRPYEVLDSFYVGKDETKVVDLTNIYGADREEITPDLFNLEATFFIGTSVDESTGTVQISLNTAEQ